MTFARMISPRLPPAGLCPIAFAAACSIAVFAQTKSSAKLQEFPVTLRQNIVAGKTPVGEKVEANLTLATLVDGKVIPEGATFSGEVVASIARTEDQPSRLAIRMNSVRWKKGSVPVIAYVTNWYYPVELITEGPHPDRGIHGDIDIQAGGSRPIPPASQPTPRRVDGAETGGSSSPASKLSDHRVLMKDVDSATADDGTITISSTRSNLKLDKSTTYVLATGNLTRK